jgi:hypothetical protein
VDGEWLPSYHAYKEHRPNPSQASTSAILGQGRDHSSGKSNQRYKIVINSPEVHFVITRQHAGVGHKNIIIFVYKNHLGRFCKYGK